MRWTRLFRAAMSVVLLLPAVSAMQGQRTVVGAVANAAGAVKTVGVDAGLEPVSASVDGIVVTLKRSDAQQSDLDTFLSDATTPGSAGFHKWLTPAAFAARFQPSDAAVAAITGWLSGQGLVVDSVSNSRTRIYAHGTVAAAQSAFGVELHQSYGASGMVRVATTALSVPTELATDVSSIEGVSFAAITPAAESAWSDFTAKVEANVDAVLTLKADAVCAASDANELSTAYLPVLQQAAAQGITVLVSGTCSTGALAPAATAYATAVVASGDAAATSLAVDGEARPGWQAATGLPDAMVRAVPDLALSGEVETLADTFRTIVTKAGVRQGDVNATLYALSATDGVYDQAANTWTAVHGLGTVNLDNLLRAYPLGTTTTSLSLVSSNYSPTHGSSVTLTATLNGTTTQPTGTITIQSPTTGTVSTQTLSSGTQITFSTATLDGGAYQFTATYVGDDTYAGATSSTASVNVQPEETSVSATTTTTVLGSNIPVVVTARSTSGVGTPTGTVTVQSTGSSSSTTYTGTFASTATGTATATVQVPTTIAGNQTLIVKCATPNSSFACNTSTSVQATITKGTPTAVVAAAAGSTKGSYTLTATVTGATGADAPSGAVSFMDGTTVLGTGTLASGTATTTATFTGAAAHSITASYAGDNNYNTATSSAVSVTGAPVTTTITLTTDKTTGQYGATVNLTSTVSPASLVTGTTPSGTITFSSSLQGNLGTVNVATYSGVLALTNLTAGTHSITATYNGDTNYAASTSTAVTVTVTASVGTLAATISSTTAVGYGSTATVNATVTTASGAASAGQVQAVVNGATYVADLVPGTTSSTAAITVDAPLPGTYSVAVSCVKTASFSCTNTVTLSLKSTKGETTTTVSLTPAQPLAGSPTTVTATVASAGTGTSTTLQPVTGTVSLTDNGISIGSGTISGGVVSVVTTLAGGKTHSIVATYSGNTNWAASVSSAAAVIPTPVDPTITLKANTLTPLAGSNVTLTATVTAPADSTLFPSGTVKFYDSYNGTLRALGSATLASNGVDGSVATFSSTNFSGGDHMLYAQYAGDGSFNAVQSATLVMSAGDFSIALNPSQLTVLHGAQVTSTALVAVQGGFAGTVSVSCTPSAAALATCAVSPSVLSGGASATITVTTTAGTACSAVTTKAKNEVPMLPLGGVLACVIFSVLPKGSRRIRSLLMLALMMMGAATLIGCATGVVNSTSSGGSGGTATCGGTPLGTSIFTVTGAATDGSTVVRHSYSLQVTVQ